MQYHGQVVRDKMKELLARSRKAYSNVTLYKGPEIKHLAEACGQWNKYGGYNWDTRVRNRSAGYTVIMGDEGVAARNPSPSRQETIDAYARNMARVFGGHHDGVEYPGHANQLSIDLVHRVMGSGADIDFTFNLYLYVTAKDRKNHHIPYMWGKMCRQVDPVQGAESVYQFMIPDVNTGELGRFYCWPDYGVTVGLGSDYVGEAKKGMLRMCMYKARKKGILGLHSGAKIVKALDEKSGRIKTYGVLILGPSGTGKTTNVGHTHFLDNEGEAALVVQDDFVGARLSDGRILGTEQAMFLKTDLDQDDILLRPCTRSTSFVTQNLYVAFDGELLYREEDICANGRGILPLSALPEERRHTEIDMPPLEELDGLMVFFNTRRDTVVPILQELSIDQAAAVFMLGESAGTAGESVRVVGANPYIVGSPDEEGNMFYEFLSLYRDKIRCFVMNTGGVGGIPDPDDKSNPERRAERPWKNGIGFISRALFRNTAQWEHYPDFNTRVLTGGVFDADGKPYDMMRFNPLKAYDNQTREQMVRKLNAERVEWLERFPKLDKKTVETVKDGVLL